MFPFININSIIVVREENKLISRCHLSNKIYTKHLDAAEEIKTCLRMVIYNETCVYIRSHACTHARTYARTHTRTKVFLSENGKLPQ